MDTSAKQKHRPSREARPRNTLRTAVKLATLEASVTDVRRDETSGVGAEESGNTLMQTVIYSSSPPEYKLIPEFLAKK